MLFFLNLGLLLSKIAFQCSLDCRSVLLGFVSVIVFLLESEICAPGLANHFCDGGLTASPDLFPGIPFTLL